MSLEQAKMDYILNSNHLGYPVGKHFEAGYDTAVKEVIDFIKSTEKTVDGTGRDFLIVNAIIKGIRVMFNVPEGQK